MCIGYANEPRPVRPRMWGRYRLIVIHVNSRGAGCEIHRHGALWLAVEKHMWLAVHMQPSLLVAPISEVNFDVIYQRDPIIYGLQSSFIPKTPKSLRRNTVSSARISSTVSFSCFVPHSFKMPRSNRESRLSSWLTSLRSRFSSTARTSGASCSACRRVLMLYNVLYRFPKMTE